MSSSAFKKLPPEVVRELRRHISPKPIVSKSKSQYEAQIKQLREQRGSGSTLKWVLGGCLTLVGTAASFPLIATWWISNLNEKEDALTPAQVRRGAFLNSGSKDVGRDPNWDFQTGQYKKDAGYYAIFEEEKKKKKLPASFMAMSDEKLKKHEKKIEAFAKGQAKND